MNTDNSERNAFLRLYLTRLGLAVIVGIVGVALLSCKPVAAPLSVDDSDTDAVAAESPITDTPTATSTPAAAASPLADESQGEAAKLAPADRVGMYDAPPAMNIDADKHYFATIRTEKGDMKVQLFADRAPQTVNSFIFLAREGFYDDTTFHRVIDGFMAQGGDPAATGTGGPGYMFEDEFDPSLTFAEPGLLAMANSGPATNGSQFFITLAPTEWLDGGHTIFGKVIEGEEVLDEITRIDPQADSGMSGDKIYGISIEESDVSFLPTPLPPSPTSTPFAPTDMDATDRPLADIDPAERVEYFNSPPEMVIDTEQELVATITTSQGALTVELFVGSAPTTVNNFVVLSNLGFFDGTPINLVRPDDSMIIGSPNNDPNGDAGYDINADLNPETEMTVGILTNMPLGNPADGKVSSNSSQILVAIAEPPAEYAGILGFFGRITDGMELLSTLTMDDTIERIEITTVE